MPIDTREFEYLCSEFSEQKGIGFETLLVRRITEKVIELAAAGTPTVLAMYQALDHYRVERPVERKLYFEVMTLYLSRHGYLAKPRRPYRTKRREAWREYARALCQQLKFK